MDNSSILDSIKRMLGITSDYEPFDATLIVHINSVFSILHQLGVGKKKFMISDSTATWDDYFSTEDDLDIEEVKSYMYMKVRMMFDPPSGSVVTAFDDQIKEFEWRLNAEADDFEHLGGEEITWMRDLARKRKAGEWPEEGED